MKISLEGLSSRSEQGGGGVGGEVSKSEDRTIEINQSERQRKKMKENDQNVIAWNTIKHINFSIIRIPKEGGKK